MLKRFIILPAFALISFSACHNKIEVEEPHETPSDEVRSYPVEMTFYATNDSGPKTVINDEYILWQSGDEVKVIWSETGFNKAVVSPYDRNLKAELTTTVEPAADYYGVYPYSAASSYHDGMIEVMVPSSQSGIFSDANIAIARADSENMMNFKHIVSFIEFTIDKVGVLEISGSSSDRLHGKVKVTGFDDIGTPVYEVSGGGASVTVDIKTSGTYYLALLPDASLDYLSITLRNGDTVLYASSTKPITMTPGKLMGLGNITGRLSEDRSVIATLEPFIIRDFVF